MDLRRLDQLVDLDEVSRTATLRPASAARPPRRCSPSAATRWGTSRSPTRVRQHRRLRGGAVERPVVGRVRPLRPDGRRPDPRHSARHDRARTRADVRGRPGPAPTRARVRGRVRHHHVGRRADPPTTGRAAFRRLAVRELRHGLAAVRRLAQDGPLPTVLRLSDEAETAMNLADPDVLGGGSGGVLAIIGFDGPYNQATADVLTAAGGREPRRGSGRDVAGQVATGRRTSVIPCSTKARSSRPSRRQRSGRASRP